MPRKSVPSDKETAELKRELDGEIAAAERDIKAGRVLTREVFKAEMRRHMAGRIREHRKTKRQAAE
jgi:hypothetical protein